MTKIYRVITAGEIAGRWRAIDDKIALSDEEARYLAPPLGGRVVSDDERTGNGKLDRGKRRRGKRYL